MKKKDLIKLLDKIPDDATVCVYDSYGAFSDFNHFEGDFIKHKVSVGGECVWYYVLETTGDEDDYSEWKEKEVERPSLPPKAVALVKGLFPNILDPLHHPDTKVDTWEPSIRGGSEQDKLDTEIAKGKYWDKVESLTGLNRKQLKNMVLGDLK